MRKREVTSATNSLVKVFRRALAQGVTREGALAVEGPHLVEEALGAGAKVTSVLLVRSREKEFAKLLEGLRNDAEVACVPDRLFAQVAGTQGPQGIAALVELPPARLDAILAGQEILLVVACGLQDPGNLGTILRSAQALGADALLTLKRTVSPFNPKAVRASAGAIFRLPVIRDLEYEDLFEWLRAAGVRTLGADRHSPAALTDTDLTGSIAILIGQEAAGLAPEIRREVSLLVSIPIRVGADSVNAATAAGIFLYEAARQRGFRYGFAEGQHPNSAMPREGRRMR